MHQADSEFTHRIPLQVSRHCIIGSIQTSLTPQVLSQLEMDMLALIEKQNVRAVIIELSGVEFIDPTEFMAICRALNMASLMGVAPIICGLRPAVVSALVDLGVALPRIPFGLDIDDAFNVLAVNGLKLD
jgi:rsbT antagonist protein RsbS